jgi:hypothetical protein
MAVLEDKLIQIRQKEQEILNEIDKRNSEKNIKCAACSDNHKISDLEAVQTHHYIGPDGCCGGDYWLEGEMQFVCPTTGIVNRLLFDNNDVPWPQRENIGHNPEEQFKLAYKKLFKSVADVYEALKGSWVNNFYVDNHRKEFELVEKSK